MNLTHTIRYFEKKCEGDTKEYIESRDSTFQEIDKTFNDLYEHLYLFATCHWGCHGKEHTFERLAGKCVTTVAVARRALCQGYYDEALSLTRTLAEIANLLNLFWVKPYQIRRWVDSCESERIRDFGPVAVRRSLEKARWLIPFDREEYRHLCGTVHPVPGLGPNAHENQSQPVLGAIFQEKGFNMAYRNLVYALTLASGPIAKLAVFEREQAERMVQLTASLFELMEKGNSAP